MKKNLLVFILVFISLLPQSVEAQNTTKKKSAAFKAAQNITSQQLSDYLFFIASDLMEGRDTPSRGLDTTAEFIKVNLSRWGLKPAGDNGSFFQRIALRHDSTDDSKTKLNIDGINFVYGEDFLRMAGTGSANSPLVFGNDGWMVRSKNIDPFSGMDVKGKVIVLYSDAPAQNPKMLTQMPAGVTPGDLRGVKGTDWADPVTNASQRGASAIILIAPPQLQGAWQQVKNFLSQGSTYPEKLRTGDGKDSGNDLPVLLVSQKVGDAIFAAAAAGKNSTAAFDIGKNVNLNVAEKSETKWTQNVVAIWEGSDPVLKNEMVAVGAHYDHLGMNPNTRGDDKIFNGADDDGSGTSSMLAIAEALAKSSIRPKRSILFVWHTGEEKGLWGSQYFVKFPTVPLNKVVTQLNIDMIGRSRKPDDTNPKNKEHSGENEIYVVGPRIMSSQLRNLTESINKSFLNLNYNFKHDDLKDPSRFLFRSDHFNYASNGIPIVFWFDGDHEDYHQPGDSPDKIDYQKMERVTRTIFLTMWELADLKERPKIDKQIPPELMPKNN